MYQRVMLYYNTLRYLKPVQILGRLWFKLNRPAVVVYTNTSHPGPALRWVAPAIKQPSLIGPQHFHLLNREYTLSTAADWHNRRMEKLFLYHLHYFDDLNAAHASQRCRWHIDLISHWIHDNTPPQHEGWEPYPLSLRIVNWIKWLLQGNEPPPGMLDSLMTQTAYLSKRIEFHLQGNHLLANAKALLFAGLFFKNAGENWYQQGLTILNKQLPKQILADGGHIERSTQYHCLVLEDLLDCVNILRAFAHQIPSPWPSYIDNMLNWLSLLCHPDGEIALFNDATLKTAASPNELFSYAERLGFYLEQPQGSALLANSGYARLTSGRTQLFIDVAALGPDYLLGHAHADTFTFEFSLGQQRIIVNSGISTYEKNAERLRQRGTSAHNTLIIDKQNSSEIWDSFRVAKRAKVHNIIYQSNHENQIAAAHDGYWRLGKKIIHKRSWRLNETSLVITDEVSGGGQHHIALPFHFHPDLQVEQLRNHCFTIYQSNQIIAQLELDKKLTGGIHSSTYHPEFGLSTPNQKIIGEADLNLPLVLTTKIVWPELEKRTVQ